LARAKKEGSQGPTKEKGKHRGKKRVTGLVGVGKGWVVFFYQLARYKKENHGRRKPKTGWGGTSVCWWTLPVPAKNHPIMQRTLSNPVGHKSHFEPFRESGKRKPFDGEKGLSKRELNDGQPQRGAGKLTGGFQRNEPQQPWGENKKRERGQKNALGSPRCGWVQHPGKGQQGGEKNPWGVSETNLMKKRGNFFDKEKERANGKV